MTTKWEYNNKTRCLTTHDALLVMLCHMPVRIHSGLHRFWIYYLSDQQNSIRIPQNWILT